MTVLITKTNHDTWHRYKEFNTIEDLFNYINYCHCPLILKDNEFFQDIDTRKDGERFGLIPEELAELWETTIEDAYKINEIRWEIEIYNDYRE